MNTKRFFIGGAMILLSGSFIITSLWWFYVNSAVRIVTQVKSPDKAHNAILLVINPGAADGYSTALMIEPSDNAISRQIARLSTNRVFVLNDNNGAVPIGAGNAVNVDLQWTSNTSLTVRFPARAEVIKQDGENGGVHINYVAR